MKSLLEELKLNYNLIMKTGNEEITKIMTFSDDVYCAFETLMQTVNPVYIQNISQQKRIRVFLKRDKSGNCFLKVTGRDRNTKIIIRSDNSKYHDYIGIIGYKVKESIFSKTLDLIQKEKLERSGISKRFIKEIIPEIDLCEELDIEKFINICKEIEKRQNDPEATEIFDEPENTTERRTRKVSDKESKERIHSVIPYELRKNELIKYNHKKIIRFKGTKTDRVFDAYIYIKHGYILAILEPISGLGYQYNLNLGYAEDYNEELIKEMIKASLEAEENIVLQDAAIIRKNHTTMENFKENIETFLNNKDNNKLFLEKTVEASKVYQRKK